MNTDLVSYPALFTPIANEHFLVSFPDIPGAFATANNLQDAFSVAVNTLGTLAIKEKELPAPSALSCPQIELDGSMTVLITADVSNIKSPPNKKGFWLLGQNPFFI